MKISIVIHAHNEEKYTNRCLSSINDQAIPKNLEVEIIVILNRCTDKTKEIAQTYGATILSNNSKNISAIKI
ncbi:hypothetical protein C3E98_044950 [Pseudomonas sp. MWU13-2625]|nr:hypothetical protein C3E98_044950 [Pseudomonas sp. MWU13-2625]